MGKMLNSTRKELITMRMKDVCERTGLTDRAVRLYIENELLSPREEINYTGRRSICFSEEDVETLNAIATLRRTDFSISDIREMQKSPDSIGRILDAHKSTLAEDIENKQRILKMLDEIDDLKFSDYTKVAELLRLSASRNHIPKEDSAMRFKDLQKTVKNRIPSVIALVLLIVGVVTFLPLATKAAFAEPEIMEGGGFTYDYTVTGERFFKAIGLFGAGMLMMAAAVLFFMHVLKGNKRLLLLGGAASLLAVIVMLILPAEVRYALYYFEFLGYRYSFMHNILYGASGAFDIFIKSLKFIPPVGAAVMSLIGWLRHRDI